MKKFPFLKIYGVDYCVDCGMKITVKTFNKYQLSGEWFICSHEKKRHMNDGETITCRKCKETYVFK